MAIRLPPGPMPSSLDDQVRTRFPNRIAFAWEQVGKAVDPRERHDALLLLGREIIGVLRVIAAAQFQAEIARGAVSPDGALEQDLRARAAETRERLGDDVKLLDRCLTSLGRVSLLPFDLRRVRSTARSGRFVAEWKAVTSFWRGLALEHIPDAALESRLLQEERKPERADHTVLAFFSAFVECRNVRAHPSRWDDRRESHQSLELGDHYFQRMNPPLEAGLEELLGELAPFFSDQCFIEIQERRESARGPATLIVRRERGANFDRRELPDQRGVARPGELWLATEAGEWLLCLSRRTEADSSADISVPEHQHSARGRLLWAISTIVLIGTAWIGFELLGVGSKEVDSPEGPLQGAVNSDVSSRSSEVPEPINSNEATGFVPSLSTHGAGDEQTPVIRDFQVPFWRREVPADEAHGVLDATHRSLSPGDGVRVALEFDRAAKVLVLLFQPDGRVEPGFFGETSPMRGGHHVRWPSGDGFQDLARRRGAAAIVCVAQSSSVPSFGELVRQFDEFRWWEGARCDTAYRYFGDRDGFDPIQTAKRGSRSDLPIPDSFRAFLRSVRDGGQRAVEAILFPVKDM